MWLGCQELQQGRPGCLQLGWEESKLYITLCILTGGPPPAQQEREEMWGQQCCGHLCQCSVCVLVISVAMCVGVYVACAPAVCTGLLETQLQPHHTPNQQWWRGGKEHLSWAVVFKGYCFFPKNLLLTCYSIVRINVQLMWYCIIDLDSRRWPWT